MNQATSGELFTGEGKLSIFYPNTVDAIVDNL